MFSKKGLVLLAIVAVLCVCAQGVLAGKHPGNPETVEIMTFGGIPGSGGQPSPGELAANVEAVDKLPIQGFVYNITHNKGYFASKCVVPEVKYCWNDVKGDVELMKSFEFKSGKKFFARINVSAELTTDWFDDNGWDVILNNIRIASRAAAEVGAVGFCLDNEQYGGQPFNYTAQAHRVAKSFEQYSEQARKRGREFAEALTSHLPEAKIMFLFGNSHIANVDWPKSLLYAHHMGLWPAFLDGMMDAAPEAEFIDGHEDYGVRTFKEFKKIRELIKKKGAVYSADPKRYKKRVKACFSIWLKADEGIEMDLDMKNFANNNHTP